MLFIIFFVVLRKDATIKAEGTKTTNSYSANFSVKHILRSLSSQFRPLVHRSFLCDLLCQQCIQKSSGLTFWEHAPLIGRLWSVALQGTWVITRFTYKRVERRFSSLLARANTKHEAACVCVCVLRKRHVAGAEHSLERDHRRDWASKSSPLFVFLSTSLTKHTLSHHFF